MDKTTPGYYTDAKVAELAAAFKRVEDIDHWKNPIDRCITIDSPDEQALIREAVIFYTGSVPTFTAKGRIVRVQAAGYYLTIGA